MKKDFSKLLLSATLQSVKYGEGNDSCKIKEEN